ncbi:hypothetical protein F5X98DRAFT_389297 [Xylaria grammica]|nr:hypothetical protein F5X98DRAFT_389297 [Xylaria grammica]
MSKIDHETCLRLAEWYESVYPRRVDIVGDFGGKQLFLIDGDSLLHYSVTISGVDYDVGFQLLHAIFAVESFLQSLQIRGCNFHVVFFDNQKELCVPSIAPEGVRYKYQMTRVILIRHLQRSNNRVNGEHDAGLVFSFPSIDSQHFRDYLTQHPATFLLCHDGHAARGQPSPREAAFLYMIHQFLQLRHSVALIYGIQFKSSRVIMPMITAARKIQSMAFSQAPSPTESLQALETESPPNWALYKGRSYREILTAIALCKVLKSGCVEKHKMMVVAVILHDIIISHTRLAERSLAQTQSGWISKAVESFMENFCQEITNLVESDLGESLARRMDWDAFDIIDGRLFLSLHAVLSEGGPIPAALVDKAKPLITCVEKWSGIPLLDSSYLRITLSSEAEKLQAKSTIPSVCSFQATILPFNHPLLNNFLERVHLQTTLLHEEVNENKVFRELTHWHNAKSALESKRLQKKPGFWARKRNQKFMADTLGYSASLTNAAGKLLEPKTIVVDTPTLLPKKALAGHSSKPPSTAGTGKHTRDSGKNSARGAALLTQTRKLEKKNIAILRHWQTLVEEFDQEEVLIKRFKRSIKYFLSLTREESVIIGAEVSLYICDTLYCAWKQQEAATTSKHALGIGSLLFNQIIKTSLLPSPTREVSAAVRILNSVVGIPSKESSSQKGISRPLSFRPRVYEVGNHALLALGSSEFQLGHCGPFLERTFDSRKDDRVPFEPDAWQRSVLDSIDANDSLFIVAPTSSGKTFISFYAMEKILRGDDDGVLVYVAPTKALVNQIAAEIHARFRKRYHHEGKSVWAIHTRDYRVNNPTGCQILVTVPHVLQIMLLSPSNANSWSKRVKRIIFDEVHCIGQADDGIIWEQLLLMAPCPIIALSATVGNPEEFCEWLKISQTSKGFNFRMITHNIRYSDLRAFHYAPPEGFEFKGLRRDNQFPVPGLDRPNRATSSFQFIHPIATLANRTGVDLEELSLEPRDALTLWEEMNKLQTEKFPLDDSLYPPQASSGILRKSDALLWIQRLKNILAAWMQDDTSPFDQVCYNLGPDRMARHSSNSEKEQASHTSRGSSEQPLPIKNGERSSTFALLCDLYKEDGLPAILFNYDRVECERTLEFVLQRLVAAEEGWKESNRGWQKDLREYELWKSAKDKRKIPKKGTEKLTKHERMREEANTDVSRWESFDPKRPQEDFSFADNSRLTRSELEGFIKSLDGENIRPHLFSALERGIAVHHAGMNRSYRQVVEILFRKGFLTAVIATGTLALGINMPCKTVAFVGDSAYLTTLNYRQGAGRAGRRGFDLLGNVVFSNISKMRAYELMSSRLPDLKGHFPLTTTLVLRILGLVDAAGQSSFASGIVESLLTQNRLYLGGEEAGKSIQHHLRFSVEYLQRQRLLSADGRPMNFAGLVGHLYFTENAVFAFHSLLKGGYFHRLCSNIYRNTTDTLRTLSLVMAHLFNRIEMPKSDTKAPRERYADPGPFSLPRLPDEAEKLLICHNNETLEIFKAYAGTYIDQYLGDAPDRNLPFTGIATGGDNPRILHLPGDLLPTKLRSPFSALSGHSDDFKGIHELCSNVRSGVFLEESAVPYIPIWPHDVASPFNSYIYDFLKHGDYVALTRDNKIRQGDVWFLLKDFSLVLATIVASLTNFIRADANTDDPDMIDVENADETPDKETLDQAKETSKDTKHGAPRSKPTKKKVVESWEDDSEGEDEDAVGEDIAAPKEVHKPVTTTIESSAWEGDGKGLVDVLEAFTLLKQDFDDKFHKAWA